MDSAVDHSRDNHEAVISMLRSSHAAISAVLLSSIAAERDIAETDRSLLLRRGSLAAISGPATRLHSQAVASKVLHARINRAVSPSFSLPLSISLAERLERIHVAFGASEYITKNVDCVDQLRSAATSLKADCEPAVQMLQEAVEFLWRTKTADRMSLCRIKEYIAAFRESSEEEVWKMNYKTMLVEALVRLQDEYKKMLRRLRHADVGELADDGRKTDCEDRLAGGMEGSEWRTLGSVEERAVLRRISEVLISNDCLSTCIDIFVKVRQSQATKAMARLNLDCVNEYMSEGIGYMDNDSADTATSQWIRHFRFAVTSVLPAEKHLCIAVLSSAMDGTVWPECFARISHRIMLVLLRFAEDDALSPNEPHKLINLLKMTDTTRRLRPALSSLFDDCVPKISARARDVEKLLVGSAFRAFSALALRIDGIQNDFPPPTDASVPSVVVNVVNFLKCVAADRYGQSVAHAFSTEVRPKPDQAIKESFINVLDVLQRNVETIWDKFKDRIAAHLFAMNTNWYMYIETRGSELAVLVGEEEMRRRYKGSAEVAAYAYQAEAWEPMASMLEKGEVGPFMRAMRDNLWRHRRGYGIQDADLREQIKEAVVKMLVSAYEGFLHVCSGMVQGSSFVRIDDIRVMLGWIFDGGGGKDGRKREKVVDEMLASVAVALSGRKRTKQRRRRRKMRNARLQFGNDVGSKAGDQGTGFPSP